MLALWGAAGLAAQAPVLEIWRQYADVVTGEPIRDCGHFIAEEAPDPLLRHLRDFLGVRGVSEPAASVPGWAGIRGAD